MGYIYIYGFSMDFTMYIWDIHMDIRGIYGGITVELPMKMLGELPTKPTGLLALHAIGRQSTGHVSWLGGRGRKIHGKTHEKSGKPMENL